MNKISITIDLGKLDKSRVVERKYTDRKTGEIKTVKELKLDIVPVREPKAVWQGQDSVMIKTHFVAHQRNEQEKMNNANSPIVGEGITFEPRQGGFLPGEPQNTELPF